MPFCVTYTNRATGELIVKERPRLAYTVDGAHKSLFLGDTVIATVRADEDDTLLWAAARAAIGASSVF